MTPSYLKQYREGWYVRVRVPRELRSLVGTTEVKRTLKTRDKREAQRRKHAILAEIMKRFDLARKGIDVSVWNAQYSTEHNHYTASQQENTLRGLPPSEQSFEMQYSPVTEILAVYLDEKKLTVTNQTFNTKKRRLREFADHIGFHKDISTIKKRDAGQYVTTVLVHKKDRYDYPLSVKTKKDIASDIRAFFHWCEARGYIETNPFSNIMTTLRTVVKGSPSSRRGWNRSEIATLLSDHSLRQDRIMMSLILLGLFTGMRGNEIAELRLSDVTSDYLRIVSGKNNNSVRKVPIHYKIAPLVTHLKFTSADEYLLEGLTRGGEDKKRYHNIGKKFNRRKDKLGFGKDTVFHSFRHSLATALENAGVAHELAESVVGHNDQNRGLTYSLYSDGLEHDVLAETMNKASYGEEVDSLVDEIICEIRA